MQGGCLCGALRYEISAIGRTSHCFCSMCRKAHGAYYATYGRVPVTDFQWLGATETRSEYHSSEAVTRVFCGRCGSPILWLHRDAPERVALALSSLDRDPGTRTNLKLHFEDQATWLFCPFEDSESPGNP